MSAANFLLDELEARRLLSSFSVLTDFPGTTGHAPTGPLIMDARGDLFGVSEYGGTSGDGNVYEIAAGTDTPSTVASFDGTDGSAPQCGLVMDAAGDLFGTTNTGGPDSVGTVFEIPSGASAPTMLDYFTGANGSFPYGSLLMDSDGNLYGTTSSGGQFGDGSVFEVGASDRKIDPLAIFSGAEGATPYSGLVADAQGNFYGTTSAGGTDHDGTVFQVAAVSHTITAWASFTPATGQTPVIAPQGSLIIDAAGNLYGTESGGGASVTGQQTTGFGDVFEVAASAGHAVTVLASFGVNGDVEAAPTSGVIMDADGNLFGTTLRGTLGASTSGNAGTLGNVFEVAAGSHALTTLHAFNDLGTEGGAPIGGLVMDAQGNLIGATSIGNFTAAEGTIFQIAGAATPFAVNLFGGELFVNGTAGDDTITLSGDGNDVTAAVNDVAATPDPIPFINAIDIEAGAGNDSVTIQSDMPSTLGVSVQGGPGDDTIQGGPGNDTLGGGQGNDSVLGGPGDDFIRGGAGNDTLAGGQGNDSIFGSLGDDVIRGALGDDYLNGGAGTNQLYGGQGNNTFYAANGKSDQIFAGSATNDSLDYSTSDNPIIESGSIPVGNQSLVT